MNTFSNHLEKDDFIKNSTDRSLISYLDKVRIFEITRDVTLEYRGRGKWAVVINGNWVINKEGNKEYEPMPSYREKDFLERTRFSFKEAKDKAFSIAESMESGD